MASALGVIAVVLCVSLLEGLWTWLIAAAIAEVAGQAPPPLIVVGHVLFLAWLTARLLAVANVSLERRRQVLALGGIALALVAGVVQSGLLHPLQLVFGRYDPDLRGAGITLLLVVTYLWGRGLALAGPLSRERVLNHIGASAAGLSVVLIFMPLSNVVQEQGLTEVLASFLVGIAGLLLVQLHGVESRRLSPLQWTGVASGAVMLLVVGGAVATGAFASGGLSVLAQGVGAVGRAVSPFTNVFLLAGGYLAQYLFYLVQWLATVFHADPELITAAVNAAENVRPRFDDQTNDAPEVLGVGVVIFVTLLFIATALYIYYRLIHRQVQENTGEITEERFREGPLNLGALLRGALDRFGRGGDSTDDADRRLAIRRRYRDFQTLMARADLGRGLSQTPHEFQGKLGGLVPTASEPLAVLTSAYVLARYGEVSATLPELAAVDQALGDIREALGRREWPKPANAS